MIVTIDSVCIRVKDNKTPQVLLRRRDKKDEPAYGEFALTGGWVWEKPIKGSDIYDANIDQALDRILRQKLGAKPKYIEQIPSVGSSDRDTRDWSITVLNFCFLDDETNRDIDKSDEFKWESLEGILNGTTPLPFDHQYLVAKAWFAFIQKAAYSTVGLFTLPSVFTTVDAIHAFDAIGIQLNKQTAGSRFKSEGIIVETGEKESGHSGAPRALLKLGKQEVTNFSRLLVMEDKYDALKVITEKETEMRSKWV